VLSVRDVVRVWSASGRARPERRPRPLVCRDMVPRSTATGSPSASPTPTAAARGAPAAGRPPARATAGLRALAGRLGARRPAPDVDRMEYAFELQHADGGSEWVTDPGNPERVGGAFGDKSVLLMPGYAAPAWTAADPPRGRRRAAALPAGACRTTCPACCGRARAAGRRRGAAARRPRRARSTTPSPA
jgi:hypothetical protein